MATDQQTERATTTASSDAAAPGDHAEPQPSPSATTTTAAAPSADPMPSPAPVPVVEGDKKGEGEGSGAKEEAPHGTATVIVIEPEASAHVTDSDNASASAYAYASASAAATESAASGAVATSPLESTVASTASSSASSAPADSPASASSSASSSPSTSASSPSASSTATSTSTSTSASASSSASTSSAGTAAVDKSSVSACQLCNKAFGLLYWKHICGCHKVVCAQCFQNVILPEGKKGANNVVRVCKKCFKEQSSLDHSKFYDFFGPSNDPAIPALLFVHGGGGCRSMWGPQIRALSTEFRCYAIDLPGHGSRMNEPLSLASAVDTVTQFVEQNLDGQVVIYVGDSLGGYLGMHIVGEHPHLFAGAVICSAGQNVGPGSSLAARLGLVVLEGVTKLAPRKTVVQQLVASMDLTNISEDLIDECNLRCGLYFDCAEDQIRILKTINPAIQLPKYSGPLLFLNGGKDHHDSQDLWMQVSKNGHLFVHQDGDHFFTHDRRFMPTFIQQIRTFVQETIHHAAAPASSAPTSTATAAPALSAPITTPTPTPTATATTPAAEASTTATTTTTTTSTTPTTQPSVAASSSSITGTSSHTEPPTINDATVHTESPSTIETTTPTATQQEVVTTTAQPESTPNPITIEAKPGEQKEPVSTDEPKANN